MGILRTLSSLPGILRIYRSAVQRTAMEKESLVDHDFGYSFLSESIAEDLLSPNRNRAMSSECNSDDPILYTAPLSHEEEASDISSMKHMIKNERNINSNQDYSHENSGDDISDHEEATNGDGI